MTQAHSVELELGSLRLQREKNASRAVAKLPRELLSRIFLDIRYSYHLKDYSTLRYQRKWLMLLHVCHMWREVALGTALLWNWIEPSSISRTQHHIAFSRGIPLNMLCQSENPNMDAVDIVMSQFHRFKTMTVDVPNRRSLYHVLGRIKDTPAPLLEELVLGVDRRRSEEGFVLPADVPLHKMSALRVCTLTRGTLTVALPSIPRLEDLTFSADGSPLPIVLASLKNNPGITDLCIDPADFSANSSEEFASLQLQPISLPKLENIHIVSDRLEASRIFDLLDYPSCLGFEFKCYNEGQSSLSSLANVCAHVARMAPASEPGSPMLELKSEDYFLRMMYHNRAFLYFELPLFLSREETPELLEILLTTFGALPWSKVQHLCADNLADLLRPSILDLFTNVILLTVRFTDARLFLDDYPDDARPPFPKLKFLRWESDCFATTATSLESQEECLSLFRFLDQRKHIGLPIRSLELATIFHLTSEIDEIVLEELRDLVDWLDIM
ncbi:hypothetical protein ONZ45_g11348 [Pleurotus djamor]|nr:hypothetical protein ONZ45_g11348 [Pleurotus djamor]